MSLKKFLGRSEMVHSFFKPAPRIFHSAHYMNIYKVCWFSPGKSRITLILH